MQAFQPPPRESLLSESAELRAKLLAREDEIAELRARLREREAAADPEAPPVLSPPSLPSGTGSHAAVHAADGAAGPQGREQESLQELHERLAAAGVQLPRLEPGSSSSGPRRSKALETLHWELQERLSLLTFEGGSALRHVELVKVILAAEVHGTKRSLVERDCFSLTSGAQRAVLLPLRRKLRPGQPWREAVRSALTDKVGLPPSWQDQHLQVDEASYRFLTLREAPPDFPQLPAVQRVHEVHVLVDTAALQEASISPLERIGLPNGHDFVSREVRPDGKIKLHVWSWKSRAHEEPALVQAFERYLAAHGVDVGQFGVGTKKSLFQLYVEVKELKESSLKEMPDGTGDGGGVSLLRVSELLSIRLLVEVQKRTHILTASEQFLDDGRRRKVRQLLVTKVREGESWREAVPRAFLQRLGLPPEVQKRCLRLEEGREEYEEKLSWSKGYPLRTLYKVRTVTMSILDPEDMSLEVIGLPRGNDFVTKEGQLGQNQRGRLHVWAWVPHGEEPHVFMGTGYEGFCRALQDAENLVAQMVDHPQMESLGLLAPLTQSLEKIQSCIDKAADMDQVMAEVDVPGMMRIDEQAGRAAGGDLAEFISSTYTRRRRKTATLPERALPEPLDMESPVRHRATCPEILPVVGSPRAEPAQLSRCLLALQEGRLNWGLDLFELADQCSGRLLQSYGEVTLASLCKSALRCEREAVQEFLASTASMYSRNPYHNDVHAVQVCHTAAWLADATGLVGRQSGLERAAFHIAALCHDVKHFGRSNSFVVETQHALALRYNDVSVLENMHAATCYGLLQGAAGGSGAKGSGMLAQLGREERSGLRSQIIEYILSTDMSEHFEVISKFRMRREAADFAASNEPDRRFVARLCMKAGDISHSALPWDVHEHWSRLVAQEFLEQGDEEKRLGLPVSPLCDRRSLPDLGKSQRGFLEFVCLPLFEELASYEVLGRASLPEECPRAPMRATTWPRVPSPSTSPACSPREDKAETASQEPDALPEEVTKRWTVSRSSRSSRMIRTCHLQQEAAIDRQCAQQIRENARRWVEDADAVARIVATIEADCPLGSQASPSSH